MIKKLDSVAKPYGFKSQLWFHHFLALFTWTSFLTSLCLSFFTSKTGLIIVLIPMDYKVVVRTKLINIHIESSILSYNNNYYLNKLSSIMCEKPSCRLRHNMVPFI